MNKTLIIVSAILVSSCSTGINQYQRSDDWLKGYKEGHNDGRYIGYKIKEMEIEADNELNRKNSK